MDFFAHQERARRQTKWLVGYFLLSLVCIVAGVYGAVVAGVYFSEGEPLGEGSGWRAWWSPELMLVTALAVLVVVGIGMLYRLFQLRHGGASVAKAMGGRLVGLESGEPMDRQLLNVVEEMAIASGTPVPAVYVLDQEESINAFAAGLTPNDAAIGVTRGTLRLLSRDELQGVVAHEFSHILNGDMRLNTRIIALLGGILLLSSVGQFMVRNALGLGRARSRSSSSDDHKIGLAIAGLGLILVLVGYVGYFWGRLIQAAVSRQREYLADAAAVQFTRQPQGIAGALRKIGGWTDGSRISHANVTDASHLFFGSVISSWFNWTATHPPLDERIRRIDPSFDGNFAEPAVPLSASAPVAAAGLPAAGPWGGGVDGSASGAVTLADRVGSTDAAALAFAHRFVTALPMAVQEALRQPEGAQRLVFALLLAGEPAALAGQLARLAEGRGREEAAAVEALLGSFSEEMLAQRLVLAALAANTLKGAEAALLRRFWETLDALILADQQVSLYELCLRMVVGAAVEASHRSGRVYHAFKGVRDSLAVVLSALAVQSGQEPPAAAAGFAAAVACLGGVTVPHLPGAACTPAALQPALVELAHLAPSLKRQLVNACAAAVGHDGRVTQAEAELLRAVCAVLGCPLPPILHDSQGIEAP